MILVGIMLVTDLIMVAIVAAVYGGKTKYQSGMILGIHLPKEVISQLEVVELTQKYKTNSRYFYNCYPAPSVSALYPIIIHALNLAVLRR